MALVLTPNSRAAIDCTGSGENYAQDAANACRIVAAVNACAALPTEALEGGVVADLLDVARAFVAWYQRRDQRQEEAVLRAACEAIAHAEGRAGT
jgi:hypothetical protein